MNHNPEHDEDAGKTPDPQNVEIGIKLQQYREAINFTQEEMVVALKSADRFVSLRTYQRYEAGETTCPAWVFKRVELTYEVARQYKVEKGLFKVFGIGFIDTLKNKLKGFFG